MVIIFFFWGATNIDMLLFGNICPVFEVQQTFKSSMILYSRHKFIVHTFPTKLPKEFYLTSALNWSLYSIDVKKVVPRLSRICWEKDMAVKSQHKIFSQISIAIVREIKYLFLAQLDMDNTCWNIFLKIF